MSVSDDVFSVRIEWVENATPHVIHNVINARVDDSGQNLRIEQLNGQVFIFPTRNFLMARMY